VCISLMFYSLKRNKTLPYILFSLSLLFLVETRAEAFVMIFISIIALFFYRIKEFRKVDFWVKKILPAFIIFSVFITIPIFHYVSHYFYGGERPLYDSMGVIFSIFNVADRGIDSIVLEFFFADFFNFWTDFFFMPIILFVFLGLLFTFMKRKKTLLIFSALFILQNLVFLLWNNGYQPRYAMQALIPYIIFAAFGLVFLEKLLSRYKDKFKPVAFVVPVFLIAVFVFLTLSAIGDRFLCTDNPLVISHYENEIQPFIENTSGMETNILTIGDEIIMHKLEFILTKNVYVVNDHISHNLLLKDPFENATLGGRQYAWAFEADPELLEEKERLRDLSFMLSVEDLINNEEKLSKFKKDLIRENTFLITKSEYEHKEGNYTFYRKDELFDLENVQIGDNLHVYRVIG
jgi:hypothetical protein